MDEKTIGNKKVVYYPGCFTNYYAPEVGKAAVEVLRRNGVEIVVPDEVCCGLPMMAKGNIKGAYTNMEYNARVLSRYASEGYAIVTTCTSCDLMIKRDYPIRLESREAEIVSGNTMLITEYLLKLHEQGLLDTGFEVVPKSVFYFTPCHLSLIHI